MGTFAARASVTVPILVLFLFVSFVSSW